jgi:hypothetical protein
MLDILKNRSHRLFIILSAFFITNALVAEFIGGKIFSLESTFGFQPLNIKLFGVEGLGFNLTAGVLLWPFVFIMTDIINEYYGKKAVKFLSYLTSGLILYGFIMVFAAINVTPNEWWKNLSGVDALNPHLSITNMDLSFNKVMGQGLWIILGSLVAFLVGQILDVFIFQKVKSKTGERGIWIRATVSTLVSQFVDSFVVLIIAFYIGSDWDLVRVLAIGTVNYIYKFVIAFLLIPLIYFVHFIIERYLGENESARMKQNAMID